MKRINEEEKEEGEEVLGKGEARCRHYGVVG